MDLGRPPSVIGMQISEFKLERYFARYEFCTQYLMCSSDPESWTTREILALEPGSEQRYLDLRLSYRPSEGQESLRAEVAKVYTSIDADDVLMFSGAEEGIFCFAHALLRPGDHVIVHTPCYQSHLAVAESLGALLSPWPARESLGWSLDPDELQRLIRPNTKALFLNTPHNPTGYLMDAERFSAVCQICDRHGIVLFGDEVFRESELDAQSRLPAACDALPTAVSLGVMSKTYGLPGLRIGWIATHQDPLRRRMAAVKDYTTICNSGPSEFLAEIGLRHRGVLSARTVGLLRENLGLLDAFFARHREQFSWVRPQASPMAFPKLCVGNVEDFCDRAVREAGVLLLPASVYDDPDNHFRIGFGRKNFPEALRTFEVWLDNSNANVPGRIEPKALASSEPRFD